MVSVISCFAERLGPSEDWPGVELARPGNPLIHLMKTACFLPDIMWLIGTKTNASCIK
jgi:hypothetical protein